MNLIFLILPVLSHASITFNITISPIEKELKVTHDGHDLNVVSDLERQSFELTAQSVKEAVATLYPDTMISVTDVYVRDPTPWGDLYKTNQLLPVTRETKVQNSFIKSFKIKPGAAIHIGCYTNHQNNSVVLNFENGSLVLATVARNLYEGTNMSVSINHNINLRHGIKPVDTLNFVSELNNNTLVMIEKRFQVKSKSGLQFMLHPKHNIVVSLMGEKVIMELHVNYTTRIRGAVVVNDYNPIFTSKNWDFRVFSVGSLLNAIKKPQEWNDTSVLFIEYYANAKLVFTEKGKVIQEDELEYDVEDKTPPLVIQEGIANNEFICWVRNVENGLYVISNSIRENMSKFNEAVFSKVRISYK